MAENTKTPEQRYDEMITSCKDAREVFEKMWKDVETVCDGDYKPLTGRQKDALRIKTHLLPIAIDSSVAVTMPPPNFEYIIVPSNDNDTADVNSAETAKAIANYYTHQQYGYEEIEGCVSDYFALNRAIVFTGYRPDRREETADERGEVEVTGIKMPLHEQAVYIEGDEILPGQAYFEKVDRVNFLRAEGFKTIKKAWASGGWVARRVFPHKDWIMENKAFQEYNRGKDWKLSEIEGDVKYPYAPDPMDDPEARYRSDVKKNQADKDYDFLINWEIYKGPTTKYPKGKFVVFNQNQKKILYEDEKMPFKGVGFPFRELINVMPRKKSWTIPTAHRAIRPLLTHEYFETKRLRQVKDAKTILPYTDDLPDDGKTRLKSDKGIILLKLDNIGQVEAMRQAIVIQADTGPTAEGSLSAKAMFDAIIGTGLVDPRLGKKIATEMVLSQRQNTNKINKHIVKINKFIEDVMLAMLTITKNHVSPQEQIRITRNAEHVWQDSNEVTLKGNYVMEVKGSPLIDMTEGERSKVLQMVMQTIVSLEGVPTYQGRIDATKIIRWWLEKLDVPTAGIIRDVQETDQWAEIAWMLSKFPAEVEATDNHTEHLSVLQEYQTILQQNNKELEEDEKQMLAKHYMSHMQFLQRQTQGAMGMNQTNLFRQAGGQAMGGGAIPQQGFAGVAGS